MLNSNLLFILGYWDYFIFVNSCEMECLFEWDMLLFGVVLSGIVGTWNGRNFMYCLFILKEKWSLFLMLNV